MSIRRQRLAVTAADLQHAANAVSEALGVQAARAAAVVGSRASALKLLKGRDVLKGTQEGRRGSVIRKRRLNLIVMETTCVVSDDEKEVDIVLPIRPKRRSGRSNWPNTREERLAMQNRKEELRQKREMELLQVARREANGAAGAVGGGGGIGPLLGFLDEDAYDPSEDERKSLAALATQVSERLGVPIEQLGPPEATVTCVRDCSDRRRLTAYEEGVAASELAAELAVEDGTAAVEFSIDPGSPPMAAGELLTFPLAQPQRTPAGDWRVVLSWRTQSPPASLPVSPRRVPHGHAE